jgi:hypothetical protein
LQLVAGSTFETVHKELIDAHRLLALLGNYTQALYRLITGFGDIVGILCDHGAKIK